MLSIAGSSTRYKIITANRTDNSSENVQAKIKTIDSNKASRPLFMLETLLNFFNKNKKPSNLETELYDPKSPANPNFLTDSDKINRLLKDVEDASPLCTIIIEGLTEEFSSSILDVQIENKHIILDELLPKRGNELLINQNKLKLSTIYNGINLAFKLSGITTGSSGGIAYYKAALPNRIYYPQRRSTPRISLNHTHILFSGISNKTHSTVGGSVFDLSRGGIGITLLDSRTRFRRGDFVNNCKIIIDGYSINFDLAVRFVKKGTQGTSKTQIGGHIENISSKSQNKLEHFITTLEREEIRECKRND